MALNILKAKTRNGTKIAPTVIVHNCSNFRIADSLECMLNENMFTLISNGLHYLMPILKSFLFLYDVKSLGTSKCVPVTQVSDNEVWRFTHQHDIRCYTS